MTGVQTGTIDMAYLGVGNAAVLKGGGALNVVYVPYLFKNKQVVPEIVNSPLFQEFYDSLATRVQRARFRLLRLTPAARLQHREGTDHQARRSQGHEDACAARSS